MATINRNNPYTGQPIGTATYTNKMIPGAEYKLAGVQDLAQAWRMAEFALGRTGWNSIDLKVKFTEGITTTSKRVHIKPLRK